MLDLQRTTHDIECCMHFVDSCWTYNQNILTILMIICGPVDIQNMFFSEYGVLSNSVIFGGTVSPNGVLFGETVPPDGSPHFFTLPLVQV